MKNLKYLILILLIIGVTAGCISEEQMEKARKYKLEYVYIEDQLELKEIPYTKTFKFKAKDTIEKNRFTVDLVYLNFETLWRNKEPDIGNRSDIFKSLIGFSYVIYDKTHNKSIFSYEVKDTKGLSVSTVLPVIFLDSYMQIEKNVNYEVVVNIPSKKDTKDQYLKPIFVIGVLQKPWL
jgi:hypothetical protein